MGTKEKLEKEIIKLFLDYSSTIFNTVNTLFENNSFLLGFELGKKYQLVCKQINRDPRFTFSEKFKEQAQSKANEMQTNLDQNERKWEENAEKSAKITSIEQYTPLYMSFYRQIDKFQSQLLESMTVVPENEFQFYLNKSRIFFEAKAIRNFTPAQEKSILDFRSTLNESQKHSIEKPLSLYQDLKLFDDYRLAVEYQLVDYEDKGWYNTVRMYCAIWIDYLKKIAEYHTENKRVRVVKKIQEEIEKIQEWAHKIENKYEKGIMLDANQSKLLGDQIRRIILRYRDDRKDLKRYEEDKNILKLISKP